MPLRIDVAELPRGTGGTVRVFGRLCDGVTLEAAQAELSTIAARLAESYPESNAGSDVVVRSYRQTLNGDGDVTVLSVMLAAVGLVLLIACANVASLLLARASRRTRELAIRTALGARRSRVVSLLVAESMILSVIGAALGALLAYAGTSWLEEAFSWRRFPFWISFAMDFRHRSAERREVETFHHRGGGQQSRHRVAVLAEIP